jgi:precorrin-6B methylase 1
VQLRSPAFGKLDAVAVVAASALEGFGGRGHREPLTPIVKSHNLRAMNPQPEIFLLGLGVCGLRHITLETMETLKHVTLVQHLTSKDDELRTINPRVENLSPLYWREGKDWDIYCAVADYVVDKALAVDAPIAFVTEGHPMIFNDISWQIASIGPRKNVKVHALPGISCLDVLPIQLGFDFADLGVQIFEATQLALYELQMNVHLSTLVLQIAEFGIEGVLDEPGKPNRHDPLVRHLSKFFPLDHPAILILSSYREKEATIVTSTTIGEITQASMLRGMTLYIPRLSVPPVRNSGLLPETRQ